MAFLNKKLAMYSKCVLWGMLACSCQSQWMISLLNYEIIVFDIITHIQSRSDSNHVQEEFQAVWAHH